MFNPKKLLAAYNIGVGYRKGDVLKPRAGASPNTFGVIQDTVVVLEQCPLAPHQYTVIGEGKNPKTPSDRFVKFSIDGHDWERA